MTKRLHTQTKIFFSNPYVVRLEFSGQTVESVGDEFRKICRRAYKCIGGTWGHSKLEYENVSTGGEPPPPLHVIGPNGIAQVNIAALFNTGMEMIPRAYFCFKDELDVLQFKLSVDARAIQVKMWPERWFTIHEVVETDES